MRLWPGCTTLPPAMLLAGCACLCSPPPPAPAMPPALPRPVPTTLAHVWMFGIERMRGDPEPILPFTNRLLATLAAMPNAQVVFLGSDTNEHLFQAYSGSKLRVASVLHGEGNCMTLTYTLWTDGQLQGAFGLIVPALTAGTEPDTFCVDRAAVDFYRALARQGF